MYANLRREKGKCLSIFYYTTISNRPVFDLFYSYDESFKIIADLKGVASKCKIVCYTLRLSIYVSQVRVYEVSMSVAPL